MRNLVSMEECLREAYMEGPSVHNPTGGVPGDIELPLLLDKVRPCHEVVKIDYHLPGCPPSAAAIWDVGMDLMSAARRRACNPANTQMPAIAKRNASITRKTGKGKD